MKKVLFIVNHAEFFASHRLAIAIAAKKKGAEIHLATSKTDMLGKIADIFDCVHVVPINAGGISVKDDLRLCLSLFQLYRKVRPDVVHFITLKPIVWGGIASLLSDVPSRVFAISGLGHYFGAVKGYQLMRNLIKQLVFFATSSPETKIIVQNDSDFEFFTSFPGIQKQKFVFIRGSGVDENRVIPSMQKSEGVVRVLFASRLLKSKGVLDFVEVAKRVVESTAINREVSFEIAGAPDNNNPQSLTAKDVEELQNEGIVHYHGHVENMAQLFSEVSVFCLPTFYGEGVPKVLIEAMAAGLPLIATDTPGCKIVVEDGSNGFLVPSQDVRQLEVAVRKMISDYDLRTLMANSSRRKFEGDFKLSRVVEKHLAYYQLEENVKVC